MVRRTEQTVTQVIDPKDFFSFRTDVPNCEEHELLGRTYPASAYTVKNQGTWFRSVQYRALMYNNGSFGINHHVLFNTNSSTQTIEPILIRATPRPRSGTQISIW